MAGCTASTASSSAPATGLDVKPSAVALQQQFAVLHIDAGGLLVTKVQPGGPAARAGIHDGELITVADGAATPDQASLADVLAGLDPGQHVTAAVAAPDGAKQTVRVTLGQLPG